jgi:hypothetical protein
MPIDAENINRPNIESIVDKFITELKNANTRSFQANIRYRNQTEYLFEKIMIESFGNQIWQGESNEAREYASGYGRIPSFDDITSAIKEKLSQEELNDNIREFEIMLSPDLTQEQLGKLNSNQKISVEAITDFLKEKPHWSFEINGETVLLEDVARNLPTDEMTPLLTTALMEYNLMSLWEERAAALKNRDKYEWTGPIPTAGPDILFERHSLGDLTRQLDAEKYTQAVDSFFQQVDISGIYEQPHLIHAGVNNEGEDVYYDSTQQEAMNKELEQKFSKYSADKTNGGAAHAAANEIIRKKYQIDESTAIGMVEAGTHTIPVGPVENASEELACFVREVLNGNRLGVNQDLLLFPDEGKDNIIEEYKNFKLDWEKEANAENVDLSKTDIEAVKARKPNGRNQHRM